MRTSKQFARDIADLIPKAYAARESITAAMEKLAEPHLRQAQVEAATECLRVLQKTLNTSPTRDRSGLSRAVDVVSDLILDLRKPPSVTP